MSGTQVCATGTYTGTFRGGVRHGYGVYTYPNGWRYEGQWDTGAKHGHGTLYLGRFGGTLEADFDHGEVTCARAVRTWGDGSCYAGPMLLGEAHGAGGEYCGADGERYRGGWVHNRHHGTGVHLSARGDRYEGSFIEHKRHGRGRLVRADGSAFEGSWESGLRHGTGTETARDGRVLYTGEWASDKPHGRGRMAQSARGCLVFEGVFVCGEPADPPARLHLRQPPPEAMPPADLFAALQQMHHARATATSDTSSSLSLAVQTPQAQQPLTVVQGALGVTIADLLVEVLLSSGSIAEGESGRELSVTVMYVGPLPSVQPQSRTGQRKAGGKDGQGQGGPGQQGQQLQQQQDKLSTAGKGDIQTLAGAKNKAAGAGKGQQRGGGAGNKGLSSSNKDRQSQLSGVLSRRNPLLRIAAEGVASDGEDGMVSRVAIFTDRGIACIHGIVLPQLGNEPGEYSLRIDDVTPEQRAVDPAAFTLLMGPGPAKDPISASPTSGAAAPAVAAPPTVAP